MTSGLTRADYVLMMVAWLSISVSSILVLLSGATSLQAAFWRVLLGALITIALAKGIPLRQLAQTIHISAGLLLGAHFLTWMESLFHIPVAVSTTLVVLYPLFLLLFDHLALGERVGKTQVLGMLTAFAGVAVMMLPGTTGEMEGDWLKGSILALVGALAAAGYFALGRIARRNGTPLGEYTSSVYLWAAAGILIYALATGSPLTPSKQESWTYLILLAIVPMLGGHSVMNYLLKKTSSSTVTSIALGEPAGATLLAWILLKQTPPALTLIGMAITLLGLITATMRAPTSKKI